MALPITNLTGHYDASDADNLFEDWQGSPPYYTGAITDGEGVGYWNDEGDAASTDQAFQIYTAAPKPIWRGSGGLMNLPCLDFDGTNDYLTLFTNSGAALSSDFLINADAFTIIGAVYVDAVTNATGSGWTGNKIVGDRGGYWGVFCSNTGSQPTMYVYNYDTGDKNVHVNIATGQQYIFVAQHVGGNITINVYGKNGKIASGTTASGNTGNLTGNVDFALPYSTGYFNGRIGEIAFYDAGISGSNLNDAIDYFFYKWFPRIRTTSFFSTTSFSTLG